MNRVLTMTALIICLSLPAAADVWKSVEASDKIYVVDTMKAICKRVDANGERHSSNSAAKWKLPRPSSRPGRA